MERVAFSKGPVPMSNDDSVSDWIEGLRARRETAVAKFWNRFYALLVPLAYHKLRGARRGVADEEDVAASALATFIRRFQQGQFPSLHDRDGLWPLLVKITERKALNLARDQTRHKRGGGKVRGESALQNRDNSTGGGGFDQVAGREPTPELAAAVNEALGRLLDDGLRQIAVLKLEGRTNEEIASRIDRSPTTVERRLRLIRDMWKEE
jgi:RNA polymerase sigma factor (sigma-70 family)